MVISKTGLRISLCGGGTDIESFYSLYGGMVISCTIDKYVYVIVKERFDDLIVLNYTQHEIVNSVKDIKHELIRECLELFGIKKGIEITTLADIPSSGSGLGSSSAVTVGILNALSAYVGNPMSEENLAKTASFIEIDNLQKPIGRQDQYACANGGLNLISFRGDSVYLDCYDMNKEKYAEIGANLFLHYTGTTRSSSSVLADQNKSDNVTNNTNLLLELNTLTEALDDSLRSDDYYEIGSTLYKNWTIKKKLSQGVTNPLIDSMVCQAITNGAVGCKICGAGGGGFLLSYVPPIFHQKFRLAMSKYRELSFNLDPFGSRIIFNIL